MMAFIEETQRAIASAFGISADRLFGGIASSAQECRDMQRYWERTITLIQIPPLVIDLAKLRVIPWRPSRGWARHERRRKAQERRR